MIEEKYVWWGFTAMATIIGYFLKVLHIDVKKEVAELKKEVAETKENLVEIKATQISFERRQDIIEKSIETEINHIRELLEVKLQSIADNIDRLAKNSK